MKYTVNVNGQDVGVSKEVYNEYRRNTPKARHERYVISKSKSYEGPLIKADNHSNALSAEDVVYNNLNDIALCTAIKTLTDKQRFVIVAMFYYRKTEQQIADELGTSQKAISKRKLGALNKLKKVLDIGF